MLFVRQKFTIPISQNKWDTVLHFHLLEYDWKDIYVSKICDIPHHKLSEFNFKMLHNLTVCREELFIWN